MWKAANFNNYPLEIEKMKQLDEGRVTRSVTQEKFIEPKTLESFIWDATRLWNKAPLNIRHSNGYCISPHV